MSTVNLLLEILESNGLTTKLETVTPGTTYEVEVVPVHRFTQHPVLQGIESQQLVGYDLNVKVFIPASGDRNDLVYVVKTEAGVSAGGPEKECELLKDL